MDDAELQASPRKKIKAEHVSLDGAMEDVGEIANVTMPDAPPLLEDDPSARPSKEAECGITEYVNPNLPGFTGVLKKRYTDFLVNEILPTGEVVHLDSLRGLRKTHQDNLSANRADPSDSVSDDHRAPPEPVICHLTQDELVLPRPPNPEHQASNEPLKNEQIPQHISQQSVLPKNHDTKVPPHLQIAKDVSANAQNASDLAAETIVTLDTPVRRKEKTILRQTSSGLVVVNEQKDASAHRETGLEQSGHANDGDKDSPQPKAAEPASSSTVDWQSYAEPSSGFQPSSEDRDLLISYFDASFVDSIVSLYNRILNSPHRNPKDHGVVKSAVIDRETRTKIHQAVRRIFSSRLESTTGDDGTMVVAAAAPAGGGKSGWNMRNSVGGGGRNGRDGRRGDGRNNGRDGAPRPFQQKEKPGWQELGGEYLHFSLLKENKDTMEVISYLARSLKMKPQSFQFAGTKDRRGVTVQRVSVYHVYADRLITAGRTLRNAKIGNYTYQPHSLQLGELTGNEFTITLRDCDFRSGAGLEAIEQVNQASRIVGTAIQNLGERGFINYYGLQRFGTFSTRTDDVGIKMLQGNFEAAVKAILDYSPTSLAAAQDPMSANDKISREDKARAYAIHTFQTTGKSHPAADEMPRKFSAETNIIRFLGNPDHKNNYLGALQMISRHLRLMYVHAYQSLVWNAAASERWSRFGDTILAGDLVLVDEHKDKTTNGADAPDEIDADGEQVVHPHMDDRAANIEDFFTRARALTKEEAESGQYTIFDVVLPTPGYDLLYPANPLQDFYKTFMASPRGGGLDPHDMRRQWRDISLSGSYRKLLARPGEAISYEIKTYTNEDEQFVETDLDRLSKGGPRAAAQAPTTAAANKNGADNGAAEGKEDPDAGTAKPRKLAVILKLQLGSSQYATMALRELMKSGGVRTWKPDFGGGR